MNDQKNFIYHPSRVRNFSIIAHIDHGKSTLADRLLEMTGAVAKRDMQEQLLDGMDLERERGITIKAHPVTMYYKAKDGEVYQMNFIDTPGHVDFHYEVSRSLSACEGALLVVDTSQGVEAQSIANVYLALERNLTILPVLNKIDLPASDIEGTKKEIEEVIGLSTEDAIPVSAKTGFGVDNLLEQIVLKIPPPKILDEEKRLKALIFDSEYDDYRGVMVYTRVFSGEVRKGTTIKLMATGKESVVTEVGRFAPGYTVVDCLQAGEVGYINANLKDTRDVKIGDTVTDAKSPVAAPFPGFKVVQPVVFAGIYPVDGDDFPALSEAFDKFQLNDSALYVGKESNQALGFGFRCGFLGLLHLEIVFERLTREPYDLDLISTAPSVIYKFIMRDGSVKEIDNVAYYPDPALIEKIQEPWAKARIMVPPEYLSAVMGLINEKRGELSDMSNSSGGRLSLSANLPMNEIITDFSDQLKSRTQGYGSFDYELSDYRDGDIVKLEIRVNEEAVDAFSSMVHRSKAEGRGRAICKTLLDVIPSQMFKVPIQGAIGGKIIARETISALSKNVTAKCYGGDITRKRKLLEKQKKGKKKAKEFGKVSIPQEAFMAVLKGNEH